MPYFWRQENPLRYKLLSQVHSKVGGGACPYNKIFCPPPNFFKTNFTIALIHLKMSCLHEPLPPPLLEVILPFPLLFNTLSHYVPVLPWIKYWGSVLQISPTIHFYQNWQLADVFQFHINFILIRPIFYVLCCVFNAGVIILCFSYES